jgi:peptide/nickel transport system substrate-binding protein
MRKLIVLLLAICLCGAVFATGGQARSGAGSEMIPGANVPRNQTIILENPGGRISPADNFNRWGAYSNIFVGGLQQLACDALWYIDPDAGLKGAWENALASERPIYNSDFTQMGIKLRQGIYWSDGVQFTADDVIYTIETCKATPGMSSNAAFNVYVDRVEKINNFELKVYLKRPNSRFHTNFMVRWGALYIMPKHVFEKQADPLTFKFNPPVSLGPYTLKDYDPQGNWFLWEKRPDWQRTTLALMGSLENAPKYAMYINGGTSDVKIMSQTNHQLDVIHDTAVEGVISRMRQSGNTSKTWFPGFPWGHPDPTLVACIFNLERPGLNNQDVRWALTLALDINRIALASYRGAMTIGALHVPPTGLHPQQYYEPMEQWLRDFTLDLGDGTTFKPYNPDAAIGIANEARKTLGDLVPTNTADIKKYVGAGWYKYDLAAAEKLMKKGGMRRNAAGIWEFNNGQPFKMTFVGQTDNEPSQNRAAAIVVELWKEFGIDVTLNITSDFQNLGRMGDFDGMLYWQIESYGGHPDLSYYLDAFHSNVFVPLGQRASRNTARWKDPRVDKIIDEGQKIGMDDPKVLELGKDFLKLGVETMFMIPISSYNVFTMMDEYYWTGYPSINDPYTDPVPNWANSRYMFVRLRPTGK